jgi:hypothetical protein
MKPKALWIIVAALLVIFLGLEYWVDDARFTLSLHGIFVFSTKVLVSGILLFGFSSVLGAAISAIPMRGKPFFTKFKVVFPLVTALLLLVLNWSFGRVLYLREVEGIQFRSVNSYEDIAPASSSACLKVHDGVFENDLFVLERSGSRQMQTNLDTGVKSEFQVEWLNPCEYQITDVANPSNKSVVKISLVTDDEYECYVAQANDPENKPFFLVLKIRH